MIFQIKMHQITKVYLK